MKLLKKFKAFLKRLVKKPRKGDALVIVLIIVTLFAIVYTNFLQNTLDTRKNLASFQESTEVRGAAQSKLNATLERLSRKGLGYFEIGSETNDKGETLDYEYSAASIYPVPTDYVLGPTAECYDIATNTFSGCDTYLDKSDNVYSDYYYTVPGFGTGNAGRGCVWKDYKDKKYQNGGDTTDEIGYQAGDTLDPLDDPCNWNKLALGQSARIPLFTYNPDDSSEILFYTPRTLKLRIRFICEDRTKEYCRPSQRHAIWDENISKSGIPEFAYEKDTSDIVTNWLINAKKLFFPEAQLETPPTPREDEEVSEEDLKPHRRFENSEITVNKLRVEFDPLRDLAEYNEDNRTSSFNILKAFVSESDNLRDSDSYFTLSNLLTRYTPRILGETLSGPNGSDVIEKPIYLEFEFLNTYFESEEGQRITGLEYQIVSDVPLGNTSYVIQGTVTKNDKVRSLQPIRKQAPDAGNVGTVFAN